MKILLDECLPLDLRHSFPSHNAHTTQWAGFKGKENGDLLRAAEVAGYEVLLTVDQGIPHQTYRNWPKALYHSGPFPNQSARRPTAVGGYDFAGAGNDPARPDYHDPIVRLIQVPHGRRPGRMSEPARASRP
ncbi:MAG: hypothetical protein WD696_16630 [Bryobacteraceae bacterium]